jgi:hypothetical protein
MTRSSLLLCGSLLTALAGSAVGQDQDDDAPEAAKQYVGSRWSLVTPDGDFENGCASGYMTFQLRANSYFIFNNRLSGSWSADESGNLYLRTRQNQRFMLVVDGQQAHPSFNLPWARIRRDQVFQRCSE